MKTAKFPLTKPQIEFLKCEAQFPAFVGGFGCLAAGSMVLTEEGPLPIERIDRPMRVLSWDEKAGQFRYSLTGGAFPKGAGYLVRIATTQGEFVAAEHHRVLCADGRYRPIGALGVGAEIRSGKPCQLSTIQDSARQALRTDGPSCPGILAGSMGRYAVAARQYGLRLLRAEGIDPTSSPPQGDVQGSCQSHGHSDGLRVQLQERSHQGQSNGLQSNHDACHRTVRLGSIEASQTSPSASEHTSGGTQQLPQSQRMCACRHTDGKAGLSHTSDNQEQAYLNSTTDATIVSMERINIKLPFYDLQVVNTNNYVCESGHIHHNSGKSAAMVVAAVSDAAQSASGLVGVYEPTFDLLNTIAMPRISAMLQLMGVPHKLNKVEKAIYSNYPRFGDFLFRSMDNPDTLVGYETFGAHADELDTLKTEKAERVWNQIIARNRQSPGIDAPNRARAYTTPEGFRFVHKRWVVEGGGDYQVIRAPTYSNPYLKPDYVDNLKAIYPEQLIAAYIEGEFVNLKSGTVYNAYNRQANSSSEAIRPREPLYIGQDFNVADMSSAIAVKRPDGLHVVEQLTSVYDTPALIELLKERYAGHKINIYPDASGGSRKTVNASTSDIAMLRRAGFRVVVDASNPAVRDRIVSVNSALQHGKLWVNERTAPEVARCLEQQAYGKNGEPDKEGGFDHLNDALGYLVVKEMPIRKPMSRAKIIGL